MTAPALCPQFATNLLTSFLRSKKQEFPSAAGVLAFGWARTNKPAQDPFFTAPSARFHAVRTAVANLVSDRHTLNALWLVFMKRKRIWPLLFFLSCLTRAYHGDAQCQGMLP